MGTGLVGAMNSYENGMLRHYDNPDFQHYGLLRSKKLAAQTKALEAQYEIKSAGLQRPVSYMSGGNLQKLLLGREL